MRGMMGSIMRSYKDGLFVTVGGGLTHTVSGFIPAIGTGVVGLLQPVVAAAAVTFAADKFVRGDNARMIAAGAAQQVIKAVVAQFFPTLGQYLGAYNTIGAYTMGDYLHSGGFAGAERMYGQPGIGTPNLGDVATGSGDGSHAYRPGSMLDM